MLSRFFSTTVRTTTTNRILTLQLSAAAQRPPPLQNSAVARTPRRFYSSSPTTKSTPMAAPTDTQAESVQNTTGITPDSLSQTLRSKLEATHVQIEDISGGCGASFEALIVTPQFQGKTLLARSRLVNAALKDEIAAIHAWSPRCLTPEQWEKEKGQSS